MKPDDVQDDDPYRRHMLAECFNEGRMVIGDIDDDGNLILDGGRRVIPREEITAAPPARLSAWARFRRWLGRG